MTSVEGLWCFQSSSLNNPGVYEYGGTVVLETGRVLGGDSFLAYIGDYEVNGSQVSARVRSVQWNHAVQVENVFGMTSPIDYEVNLVGTRNGDRIEGFISPERQPEIQVPILMLFMHPLP
jgi:hypothetical protein